MTLPASEGEAASRDRRAGLAPGFCIAARGLSTAATQIISVAAGWQIYDRTESAFLLGIIGLIQFLPGLLLVLVTGAVADRYDRRKVVSLSSGVEAIVAAGLAMIVLMEITRTDVMLAMLFAFAVARAFFAPAVMSLLPSLVTPEKLPRTIAIGSSVFQTAMVGGPVLGGVLYVIDPMLPYAVAGIFCFVSAALVLFIPRPPRRTIQTNRDVAGLLSGFSTIWRDRVLLGAISLDMFAVLLGGAVMLMPIYARDVLEVGPSGLGLLRGAAAGGGISMALLLSVVPITQRAGRKMLVATGVFGLTTVLFGLSTSFWLSITALFVMGAADMVSVYIRSTLIQVSTPDELRGRVNAVNLVFLSASNELGGFRAGMMAAAIGAVPSVALGGIAMAAIAALWSVIFPGMRELDRLDRTRAAAKD